MGGASVSLGLTRFKFPQKISRVRGWTPTVSAIVQPESSSPVTSRVGGRPQDPRVQRLVPERPPASTESGADRPPHCQRVSVLTTDDPPRTCLWEAPSARNHRDALLPLTTVWVPPKESHSDRSHQHADHSCLSPPPHAAPWGSPLAHPHPDTGECPLTVEPRTIGFTFACLSLPTRTTQIGRTLRWVEPFPSGTWGHVLTPSVCDCGLM